MWGGQCLPIAVILQRASKVLALVPAPCGAVTVGRERQLRGRGGAAVLPGGAGPLRRGPVGLTGRPSEVQAGLSEGASRELVRPRGSHRLCPSSSALPCGVRTPHVTWVP